MLAGSVVGREIQIIEDPNMNFCCKSCKLFWKVYLRNEHPLIAIFFRAHGTNFSTKQRAAVLHVYLLTIVGTSAFFYGRSKPTVCANFPLTLVKK